ncbi:uncharacterized protein G2W53_024531 [Senna tora]|uniref:Uncharacterized protein n=1 Tax=Senna tora TaxID=362788 RepID=A0A834TDC7_9FABA|nr:uncharacterized protein G2W53_024531 [Senna tora]
MDRLGGPWGIQIYQFRDMFEN